MATSLAALRALQSEGVSIDDAVFRPRAIRLGNIPRWQPPERSRSEMAARLLRVRGRAMQDAVAGGPRGRWRQFSGFRSTR